MEILLPPASELTENPITTLPSGRTLSREVRGVVQSGTLLIVINNDEYRAKAGDEFCFDGTLPHFYRNYTAEPLTATLLISNGGL
ncbi:MAG: cupin domain-containing protein [Candidatus Kapaibacterium sp.]|nr:MAG: cupin domain-containing protein [Candidatus Kapabacteria bacterium]